MLHLQDVVGCALDAVRDGMPMRRRKLHRPQDQHIECSLQHLAVFRGRLSSSHMESSIHQKII
jgi:hypothetical protein